MRVAVAVIWRPTPERERAFRFVTDRWRQLLPDAPVITADSGGAGFNRAASRNMAMRACVFADVVVLSDADCVFSTDGDINAAIEAADKTGHLVMPWSAQHYCTAAETERIYQGNVAPLPGHEGSGALYVVTPTAYWACGGMDERTGPRWGAEDDCFLSAAFALVGVERLYGTVLSLHHADEHRPVGTVEHRPNAELARRYHDARSNRGRMLSLLAERDYPGAVTSPIEVPQ